MYDWSDGKREGETKKETEIETERKIDAYKAIVANMSTSQTIAMQIKLVSI